MSTRANHSNAYSIYFITFTCYDWMHLFSITNSYDMVYKWFSYLKFHQHEVLGYVIMPNHVHCIIYFNDSDFDVNKIVSNGKRFIAYEIIKRLTNQKEEDVLKKLSEGCTDREIKKGQKHKVFEASFDAKPILNEMFLLQKLQYIHLNPISKKWSLVIDFTDYEHSSASFYELNDVTHFVPKHYKEVIG